LGLYYRRFTLSFSPLLLLPCLLTASSSASPAYYTQVTNLADASSLVYHFLLSYPAFGDGPSSVNWCGELSPLFDLDHTRLRLTAAPQVPRGPRVANWKKKSDPEFPKITRPSGFYVDSFLFPTPRIHINHGGASNVSLPVAPRGILRQICLSIH
jgi:hypothetical protein